MVDIVIDDLTTMSLEGSGIFDTLMSAVALNLDKEFDAGKLKGADYSKVYLGSITAVMQQSIAFLMGKQTADKQADLIAAQTVNEVLNGTLIQGQIDKLASDKALSDQQLNNLTIEATNLGKIGLKLDADVALTTKQVLKVTADVAVTNAQKLKIDQEVLIATQQVLNVTQDTALKVVQISKISQDISLSQEQEAKLVIEKTVVTAQKLKLDQDIANALTQNALIVNQILKVKGEQNLIDQKVFTEQAQRLDTVDGQAVAGTIGKQSGLYDAQTNGFARDAEQKMVKLMSDGWSVTKSVLSATGEPDVFNKTAVEIIMKDALTKASLPTLPPAA